MIEPSPSRVLALAVILLVASPHLCGASGQRIRTLHFGRAWWVQRVVIDPTLDLTAVPATRYDLADQQIQRHMRLYMPRTYSALVADFDVVYISAAGVRNFRLEWLSWFKKAVEEEGIGFCMTGGSESFGGRGSDPSWGENPVGEILPVTVSWTPMDLHYWNVIRVDMADPGDGMMRSLPWHDAPPFFFMNLDCRPKEGATVPAYADIAGHEKRAYPLLAEWSRGEGRSVAMTPDPIGGGPEDFTEWEYWPDMMINLMIYAFDGNPSPDYEVVHNLRLTLTTYHSARSVALSVMDFADKMGASLREAELMLSRANEKLSDARQLYVEGEMSEAASTMSQAHELLDEAGRMAVEAKNRTMVWVFLVEWLAVSGTLLLSGVVVYSLLVKRKMYKEVAATRIRG
jgi:uncharacterized membrane protein